MTIKPGWKEPSRGNRERLWTQHDVNVKRKQIITVNLAGYMIELLHWFEDKGIAPSRSELVRMFLLLGMQTWMETFQNWFFDVTPQDPDFAEDIESLKENFPKVFQKIRAKDMAVWAPDIWDKIQARNNGGASK